MGYDIKAGGYRLPLLDSEEKIDALDYLDEGQKTFAKENLPKVPLTDGWRMLGNNPDVQALWQIIERDLTSLMEDMQGRPFHFMWFTNLLVEAKLKDLYGCAVTRSGSVSTVYDHGYGYDGLVKLMMIDFPEADCWNDEERLCINFINAFLDGTMTDELFQEAIDTWGESRVVLHMSWICYIYSMTMMLRSLNMKWDSKKEVFPFGSWVPENVQAILDGIVGTHLQVRDLWREMNDFDQDPMLKVGERSKK